MSYSIEMKTHDYRADGVLWSKGLCSKVKQHEAYRHCDCKNVKWQQQGEQ